MVVGFVPPVTRPFASTVTLLYVPAVAPLAARFGFGYVPVRSPPAAPAGVLASDNLESLPWQAEEVTVP